MPNGKKKPGNGSRKKPAEKQQEEEAPNEPITLMRRFVIVRTNDPQGMSGTGIVGEGVQLTNGSCAYRFMNTEFVIESFAPNVHSIEALHSHLFKEPTEIVWVDDKTTVLSNGVEKEEDS